MISDYLNESVNVTLNVNDPNLPGAAAGSGVHKAIWQLILAMVFKIIITIFTFGMKVRGGHQEVHFEWTNSWKKRSSNQMLWFGFAFQYVGFYISLPFYCFLFVLLNYKFGSSWQHFWPVSTQAKSHFCELNSCKNPLIYIVERCSQFIVFSHKGSVISDTHSSYRAGGK